MAKKQNPATGGSISGVDLSEVERLLLFMQKHELEEFEYERSGVHIRLKKASARSSGHYSDFTATAEAAGTRPLEHRPAEAATSVRPPDTPKSHDRAPDAKGAGGDVHVIKSPIVGTFYSAPSPNADSFVTVGAKVDVGQVLCIIEAMKLMNEIESDVAGEIVEIFVENGKPVEYGEPLFGIRPQSKG
jgi:acetyl-CoA carboxylase biotin carboxyl carrier protein